MPFDTVPAVLSDALDEHGYDTLTPVQQAVLETEAQGRDLIVSAQTGSGKTVAFGLSMAAELIGEDGRVAQGAAPQALIIAPTRELALQVSREFMWLYGPAGARIATCVGGMDASRERRNLGYGAQIVVGTPGRLRDHLERGALDLSALKVAVLDEADEMLDMGFREDLEEILDATPEGRRTLLFSATMPKPIVALAKRYQHDAHRISTVSEERGHGDIDYVACTVAPSDTENAVVNLLRLYEAETAILFCATRDNVRHLHSSLIERGFSAVALSGEHSQNERNQALQALRDRRARVCVATDVAARGIDLPGLSLVIHVELPRDADTLKHRSGRTGRAGKKGTALMIVPYPRRRRLEQMLRGANIPAQWINPPSAEDIRQADRERLLERLRAPVEADDADRELAQALLAERSAEDLAVMLVQAHRAQMPAPEELLDASAPPPQRERGPRPGFEDTIWFEMNIGRRQNADPRWLLPLLCRRGHITRGEIGAIRLGDDSTHFEIPRAVADRFAEAVKRTSGGEDGDEGSVMITAADGPPAYRPRSGPPPRGERRDGSGSGKKGRGNAPLKPRYEARADSERRPPREDGERKPYGDRKPAGERKPYGDKPSFGDRKPFGDKKTQADRASYADKPSRGPRSDAPRAGGPGSKPRFDGKPRPAGKPGGKPFAKRPKG